MNRFLWPWQSDVVIEYPWILLVFFLILSLPFSIVSWVRWKK